MEANRCTANSSSSSHTPVLLSNFSVDMFFRNESGAEPYPLQLPDCEGHCPLLKFLQLTEPVVPQDWEKECQIASVMKDTGGWTLLLQLDQRSARSFGCHMQMLSHFIIYFFGRNCCGFGRLRSHPLPAYHPSPGGPVPYEVPASWLPACFQ